MASARAAATRRGTAQPSPAATARTIGRVLARRPLLGGFALYLGGALVLLLPVWTDPLHRWAGPSGDPEQAMWFLSWTPHALLHGWNPLTSGQLNAPTGVNLTWDMLMPLPGLLLAPVSLTLGPVAAYNVMVTAGVALCGVAAQAWLRRHVTRPGAALAGGALYAFGPFTTGQLAGHPNLVAAAAILPLALLAVERVLAGEIGVRRGGLELGALGALELLVWEEALATTAVAGAALLCVLALTHRDRARPAGRRLAAALAVGALAAAPVAVPFLAQQFLGAGAVHGSIQARGFFVTDPLNPVVPTGTALVSPSAATAISDRFSGNVLENDAYLGLPLLLIAIWTARRWWSDLAVRTAALTGGALFALSLGPSLHVAGHDTGIPLPWLALQQLPLVGEVLPSRLSQHVLLAVALLAAVFVDRCVLGEGTARSRRLPALGAAIAGILVVPLLPYPTTAAAIPAFFTGAGVDRIPAGSTALVVPYSHDPWTSSAMLWQAAAGMRFRMPEGYFIGPGDGGHALPGPRPTELGDDLAAIAAGSAAPSVDAVARGRLLGQMQAWGATTVIVGPMPHESAAVSFLTAVLGVPPAQVGGVEVWWEVQA